MTKQPLKVYMAGPDVFLDNALEVADQKREILKAHGFTGLHPFDNNVMHAGMSPDEIAKTIFRENGEQTAKSPDLSAWCVYGALSGPPG